MTSQNAFFSDSRPFENSRLLGELPPTHFTTADADSMSAVPKLQKMLQTLRRRLLATGSDGATPRTLTRGKLVEKKGERPL